MKTLERILKTGSLCLLFVFASCNSDDSNGDNGDDDGGQPGANHTYEIEMENDSETINLSGSVPNTLPPIAVYTESIDPGDRAVTLHLVDGDVVISGVFVLNDNNQPFPLSYEAFGENNNNASLLNIVTETEMYLTSASGNATLSNYQQIDGSGSDTETFVSFTLDFEGVFENLKNGVVYEASGTVVVQPIVL